MYILKEELESYPNLVVVDKLDTAEDIATMLDTFKKVREEVGYERISNVVKDGDNFYHFVLDGNSVFNLYEFINKSIKYDIKVSCVNANLIFPSNLSRGVRALTKVAEVNEYNEEEIPTGFLDEPLVLTIDKYFLLRESDNSKVEIPNKGFTIGRSSQKSDHVVKGNTNIGRAHCTIFFENGELKVRDLASLNGTFVNGNKVSNDDVTLSENDMLFLADEKFIVIKEQVTYSE